MTSVPDAETFLSISEAETTHVTPWWRHSYTLLVILPTLLVLAYLGLVASNQYRSEAQFVIRGLESDPVAPGGVGQLLGMTKQLSAGMQESRSVTEFLLSMDAVKALRARKIDLVEIYRRPEADLLSRLRFATPRAETLLDYYRDHVDLTYDPDDNITHVTVRAFRPEDAQQIAQALLSLGEERVNRFNDRLFSASLATADEQLDEAEAELADISSQLSAFRRTSRDLDPETTGESGLKAVAEQQTRLDEQEALLARMQQELDADSPQLVAMRSRVSALRAAMGNARGRLTGTQDAVSGRLESYEALTLRRELAAKQYETARAAVQQARDKMAKERLFIIPVVTPSLPEKAALPKPFWTSLSVFLALSVLYGIGWMVLAGIRERRA